MIRSRWFMPWTLAILGGLSVIMPTANAETSNSGEPYVGGLCAPGGHVSSRVAQLFQGSPSVYEKSVYEKAEKDLLFKFSGAIGGRDIGMILQALGDFGLNFGNRTVLATERSHADVKW